MTYLNVSAYRFVALDDLAALRAELRYACTSAGLKGTVLLAPEGINLFLSGLPGKLNAVLDWLRCDERFAGLTAKESWSGHQPFNRMLVKIKKEIITMKHPQIQPAGQRAPAVDAATLKRWLDAGHDDNGREIALLDTRNRFEVDLGTFEGALDPKIKSFGEFPEALRRIEGRLKGAAKCAVKEATQSASKVAAAGAPNAASKDDSSMGTLKDKTIVTFCTGGIRCEKAVLYMQDEGYDNVYQLDGGILKYFETVGGSHFQGNCFVFDRRVALTPELNEAGYAECFNCRAVVSPVEQQSSAYVVGKRCPHCAVVCPA